MSNLPLTDQFLIDLGFRKEGHRWINQSFMAAEWPTRVSIFDWRYAIIEQAEFTGDKADGRGESDWDWTKASDVCLKCQTEGQLLKIIEVLKA